MVNNLSVQKINKEELVPFHKRVLSTPKSPEGIVYKNMGTMENHIWSIISRRKKYNHNNWSIKRGNHLAKILAKRCSRKLYEVTEKLHIPVFEAEKLEEIFFGWGKSKKSLKKDTSIRS